MRILVTALNVITSTQTFWLLVSMDSTSKSCKRRRERYCVAGLPKGISYTNSQHTERKSVHTFPLKEKTGKDRKRHQAWVSFVRRHRPKWSSTNSSFLHSDHFDESCFTKNQEITTKLEMKRKQKPDAVPTIDLLLTDTADTIDQSLTDRAKRQVRFIYVFVFRPWSSHEN